MITIDPHVFISVPEKFVRVPEYLLPPNRCSAEMYVGVVPLEGGGQLLFGLTGRDGTYWSLPDCLMETLAKNPAIPGLLNQPAGLLRAPCTLEEMRQGIRHVFRETVSFC